MSNRERFAKELAEALRENDDHPIVLSTEELLHSTYQRLCHDDPVAISNAGCKTLQKALLDPTSVYALSNRLVEGIRHCNLRSQTSTQEGTTTTTGASAAAKEESAQTDGTVSNDDNDEKADETEEAMQSLLLNETESLTTPTSAMCYAQLAYTVHLAIPLQCCLTTQLPTAYQYIGSYSPSVAQQQQQQHTDVDPPTQEEVDRRVEEHIAAQKGLPARGNAANRQGGDDDSDNSMQEVFADESDSSDFEFESDWSPTKQTSELSRWACHVQDSWNPVTLSKRNGTASPSWKEVATIVSALLSGASTSLLSAIDKQQWKTMRISDQLTQLCCALFLPPHLSSTRCPFLACEEDDHWQRLGLVVLHVFRDATLNYMVTNGDTTVLGDYLKLIRILLQVDEVASNGTVSEKGTVNPATWVGLSSLSAMCSEVLILKEKNVQSCMPRIQLAVIDACDDLADLLDKSSSKNSEDIDALKWTYLSLFQILTAPTASTLATATNNKNAQVLLNSGLFRQWLLYWSRTEDEACLEAMQTSIFDLCVSSPNLLGKYAWRFPDLAIRVTSTKSLDALVGTQPVLSMLLWQLLGLHLAAPASEATSAPKVQWKSASKLKTPSVIVTVDSCRETAWSLFQRMCQSALKILTDWKLRRENDLGPVGNRSTAVQVLDDFGRLASRLSNALLLELFLTLPDESSSLQKEVLPIQTTLVHWPTAAARLRKPDDDDDATVDKDAVRELPKPLFPVEEEAAVQALRKSLKTLLSALDSGAMTGARQHSFSSKAD